MPRTTTLSCSICRTEKLLWAGFCGVRCASGGSVLIIGALVFVEMAMLTAVHSLLQIISVCSMCGLPRT